MIELRNEHIAIVVATKGAELQSIKDAEETEYLWQGNPKYWPRRSPILFPLVCSVENDTYRVDGQEYHLPRHGFARDKEFTVIRQGADRVTLALHESEETLKVYPFCFNLAVTYRLDGNKIHVIWHVENTDTKDIHFQIGGHPAFNVPGMKEGDQLEGCITLDNKKPLV
jgi:galactose mutarotase-like enzyme